MELHRLGVLADRFLHADEHEVRARLDELAVPDRADGRFMRAAAATAHDLEPGDRDG